eukprot:1707823-Rhodomonas_salina.4
MECESKFHGMRGALHGMGQCRPWKAANGKEIDKLLAISTAKAFSGIGFKGLPVPFRLRPW